jgi:hypothetical protein
LGRAQRAAAGPARVSAPPSFLCLTLTPRARVSGTPSSFPRRRRISFLVHHRSNLPPISLSSLVRASSGYLILARAPLRFHLTLSKPQWPL